LSIYGIFRNKIFGSSKQKFCKLHLGCGGNMLSEFDNADFFSWRKKNGIMEFDFRRPLPLLSESYIQIFTEHTLEHLMPIDANNLLKECNRILAPGGVLRLVVPDLDRYLDFADGRIPHDKFRRYENYCEAIWHLTQNNNHLSVWNYEMLEKLLRDVGFKAIKRSSYNASNCESLRVDSEGRMWESLYVEASK
jgi:predicted SAM-dependent methyltransferase